MGVLLYSVSLSDGNLVESLPPARHTEVVAGPIGCGGPAPIWAWDLVKRRLAEKCYGKLDRRFFRALDCRRLGGESNREIVSCRACVRARSVSLVRSRPQMSSPPPLPPSLFPFAPRTFPFSLVGLNGIKWNRVTSNEISWNEIEIKRDQVKTHEIKFKLSEMKSIGFTRFHVISLGFNWCHLT